jgi:hypothetical protein
MCQTFNRFPAGVVLVVVTLVLGVVASAVADYAGRSDTGFTYSNKGKCCEAAVLIAQENSAAACEDAGGYPTFSRSSARGRCDWQTQRDSQGRTRFRCTATASVACR